MIVLGVGLSAGAPPAALRAAVDALDLDALGPELGAVEVVATLDTRGREPAVLALAAGRALRLYPAARLDAVVVPRPSSRVRDLAGTRSVAEAAALLAAAEHGAGARLVIGKRRGAGVTVAAAVPAGSSSACDRSGGDPADRGAPG